MSFTAYSRTIDPDITVFSCQGRLNLGTNLMTAELELRKLIDSGVKKLILDVTGLSYIDSAGVGMIITAGSRLENAQGKLVVAGANGIVARSFEIVHLHRIVGLYPDVESAAAAW